VTEHWHFGLQQTDKTMSRFRHSECKDGGEYIEHGR